MDIAAIFVLAKGPALLAGLVAVFALEARRGGFSEALPVGLGLLFAASSALTGGPVEAAGSLGAFAAGTAAAMAPVLTGKLKARHALVFGMGAGALGAGEIPLMALFAALSFGLTRVAVLAERGVIRKRVERALYASPRFVLAGGDAAYLLKENRKTGERGLFFPLCLGLALAVIWGAAGNGHFMWT